MNTKMHCRLYENVAVQQVTGETIRPGGLSITNRALEYCGFTAGATILDVGCGIGATVEYLLSKQFQAVGIDPSPTMIENAQKRNRQLPIFLATGEQLPFGEQTMDGVVAECTLSLMKDLPLVLQEINRVLKPQGYLIVSDLYIRNNGGQVRDLPLDCCLGGAVSQHKWFESISAAGFNKELWEDHTKCLKELAGQLIFSHGSLENFWCQILGDCQQGKQMKNLLQHYKVGYFLLVARKQ